MTQIKNVKMCGPAESLELQMDGICLVATKTKSAKQVGLTLQFSEQRSSSEATVVPASLKTFSRTRIGLWFVDPRLVIFLFPNNWDKSLVNLNSKSFKSSLSFSYSFLVTFSSLAADSQGQNTGMFVFD